MKKKPGSVFYTSSKGTVEILVTYGRVETKTLEKRQTVWIGRKMWVIKVVEESTMKYFVFFITTVVHKEGAMKDNTHVLSNQRCMNRYTYWV